MRPGTKVEVFDDGQVIAAGEAADGTAHVRVVHQFGLPLPGTVLKLRQRMCPKPPPPGGATESVVVTPSPIEPLQAKKVPAGVLPAPSTRSCCSGNRPVRNSLTRSIENAGRTLRELASAAETTPKRPNRRRVRAPLTGRIIGFLAP